MVDEEKSKLEETVEEQSSTEKLEGGDTQAKGAEAEKTEAPATTPFDEKMEYSEEEYQHFVELYSRTLKDIDEGQIVSGRVLAITKSDVVVDIGFKSEGTVPVEEFVNLEDVKVGDTIEVFLDSLEDADGQLALSKKKADFMRLWDNVVDVHESGGTIEGICTRRIKGGIVVDLMGVDAFLPGSQIDVKPVRDFDALIGKKFEFRIVKVNMLRKNIVVSRRALLEESMKEMRGKILDELEKNQVRKGTVKNITDFGVFVDLGGVDGLLHINDLSWGRVKHPSEVVKLDEEIDVMILDFNDSKDRISLGMKQLQAHPWENIEDRYPEGETTMGKVVSIADYGAFIELEKGVEGLVHVSEMSWTRNIVHPSKLLIVGDEIEVKVLNIDKERKRISLGIKQLTSDPWENIVEKYPVDSKNKGIVRNMTNFGVFVELDENIDGLIHISDLSWTKKLKHPSEILKKGQDIEVIILDINKDERRLSLGYKQLENNPWPAFEEAYQVGKNTQAKVIRIIEKGIVVELPLGLEGFVPLSQMEESTMARVSQNIKEEDELEFQIIEFDKENKRIILSRKTLVDVAKKQKEADEKAEVEAYVNQKDEAPTLGEIAGELEDAVSDEKPEEKVKKASKAKKKKEESDTEKSEKKTTKKKTASKAKKADKKVEEVTEEKAETPDETEASAKEEKKSAKKASKAKKDEKPEKKTKKSAKKEKADQEDADEAKEEA